MEMLQLYIIPMLLPIIWGLMIALKKQDQQFDVLKLTRTGIIGIVLYFIAKANNVELSYDNYEMFAVANAATTSMVESTLILIYRKLKA